MQKVNPIYFVGLIVVLLWMWYPILTESPINMLKVEFTAIISVLFVATVTYVALASRKDNGQNLPPTSKKPSETDAQAVSIMRGIGTLLAILIAIPIVFAYFHFPLSDNTRGIITIGGILLGMSVLVYWLYWAGKKYHWDWSKWD